MKNKLIRVLYHLLERSQSVVLEKLLIIANVLWHDWQIHPAYGVMPSIGKISEADIAKAYRDIDAESLAQLQRFHRVSRLPEIADCDKTLFFYNTEKILTREERRSQRKVRKELAGLTQKYNLFFAPESGWHHHGLREITGSYQYTAGKIFIDAGACYGDSAIVFLDRYKPLKVCSFEPSERNCAEYRRNLKENHFRSEQYELIQKGISDCNATLSFRDTGTGGNNLLVQGDSTVEVVTLDEFCRNLPAPEGIIKADVEGFALKLLRGAEQTIRRDRPILCLSIYHNPEEFLGVYRCLKDWGIDYRIWIRLHRLPLQVHELDLVACPNELRQVP